MIFSCELAANDIDLFVADLPTGAQPNVMLIMDTSASMNSRDGPGGQVCGILGFCQGFGPSRMDIAKQVAKDFISDAQNINISVMGFNYDEGGYVIFASEDIDTGRQGAMDAVDRLMPNGFSPMAETLYEAYLYFSGQNFKFGFSPLGLDFSAINWNLGGSYRSPIVSECQKNNIILLTDGAPSYDTGADIDIERLIAGKTIPNHIFHDCHECLNEIIWYMANNDVNSHFDGDQNVFLSVIGFGEMDGWAQEVLANSVSAGSGKYYRAEDANQLSQAFADIMVRVNSESTSFAAPTVPVNAFNSLESTDELYYTVFAPSSGPDWTGNLKRYRLGDDNQIYDANGNLAIDPVTGFFSDNAQSFWSAAPDGKVVTAGGAASLLDPARPIYTNLTGDRDVELSSDSNGVNEGNFISFPDGTLGVTGMLEKIELLQWARGLDIDDDDGDGVLIEPRFSMGDPIHTQPVVVTYNPWGWDGKVDKTIFFTTNDGFLHAVDHAGYTTFSFIPKKLLGNLRMYREGTVRPAISGAPTSDSQCVWNYQVPGACVPARYCEERFEWGDLTLSESCRLIPPTPTNDDECDWDWSKAKCAHPEYCKWHYNGLFTGDTVCDIRPRHEWPAPPPEPDPGRAKVYGMDGPITLFFKDWNGDGNITDGHGHAYLYLTMRRGGSNIYSLDVTHRGAPKLRWVIKGDVDSNNAHDDDSSRNPDFPELGQTWSKVQVTKVKWQGSERYVLLFGGGYDEDADQQEEIETNDIGRVIYMVDAYSGEMLWHAGEHSFLKIPEMKYSIPADLTLVDINQDGLTDYFYAVDIGGQVFRIDINPDNTGSWNFANGGVIAQLAGDSEVDARRFFEAPTVAVDSNREYLNIAIGSGTRPSPMNTAVEDRMYVIRDRNIFNKPTTYRYANGKVITEASLYDATSNIIQHGNQWDKNAALGSLSGAAGWFMRLEDPGEKILGRASLINGMLLFSSFVPQISSSSCNPGVGLNYFYAVNIEDGTSVLNVSVMEHMGSHGRRMILNSRSIAPQPSVISKGAEMQVCIGSECLVGEDRRLEPANLKRVKRSFWRENR